MASVPSDFINVHLNAAGAAIAGQNGSIRIATAHLDYSFSVAASTRVLTSEWRKYLSGQTINGQVVLEVVPVAVVEVPAGATIAEQLAAIQAEEQTLTAEAAAQQKSAKGNK